MLTLWLFLAFLAFLASPLTSDPSYSGGGSYSVFRIRILCPFERIEDPFPFTSFNSRHAQLRYRGMLRTAFEFYYTGDPISIINADQLYTASACVFPSTYFVRSNLWGSAKSTMSRSHLHLSTIAQTLNYASHAPRSFYLYSSLSTHFPLPRVPFSRDAISFSISLNPIVLSGELQYLLKWSISIWVCT